MLFFVNEQGTTVNMVNEPVNVGSTNANEVILVAPISQANQVTIAFRLPNGATVSERIMSLLEQQLVINNKTYSVYRYLMDGTITAVSGICKVQFKIYQYQFTNDDSVRNAVLATYTSNFVIREGIFATFPETPTSTIYQQILTYLATLNPNYLVQSVDYVNENSLIEPETWISGVHNKIVCYDPTSLNAYGVTSACELSLANLFGGQNKPLFICNTEMADVYTDEDATNIGTGAKIENVSTNLHTGKIQVNISNCKYDTVIKVAHLENSSWVVDGAFVVRAANGSNVNIICGIQKTNVSAFAVFQDYNATRELDESKGDDYLPPKTAHDNDPSITEFQGFTKERYQINSVYTWAYTQDGDVWDMVGGTLQLKMLNGNIWSFPDFDYNATKLACKEYKDLAHKWANYTDDSDTPGVTNNAYYYSEVAHGWANNFQAGTPGATNNAMYYAGQAATSAVNASNSETAANNSKLAAQTAEANAHAWATGDSTDGTSPSSTNNAKYFADNAHDDADNAHNEALDAASYADLAHGWANNEDADEGATPTSTNNAKYYSDEAASVLSTLNNQKGQANGIAPLNANGKIDSSYLDPLDIHDYVKINDVADLEDPSLNVQVGDIAYLVDSGDIIASWLLTATSPSRVWVQINSSYASSAAHADSATNAGNVTTTINGKNISAIFESDGITVKNATNAVNATNSTNAQKANALMVSGNPKSGDTIQADIDSKIPKANIDTSIPVTPSNDNVPSTKLLNDTVEGVKTALENGSIKVGHAKVADNLTPYSENSGVTQENPFISQGTGTDNNSVIVTTGTIAKQLEKQGNTVGKNQLVDNQTYSNWSSYSNFANITITDSVLKATVQTLNTNYHYIVGSPDISMIANHKYLIICDIKPSVQRKMRLGYYSYSNMVIEQVCNNNWNRLSVIATSTSNLNRGLWAGYSDDELSNVQIGEYFELKNVCYIDLTQWFGSNDNIPADLTTNPSHFSWYYNGSLSYDADSLQNCNGRYLECGQGRNLFDQVMEIGSINKDTGANVTTANTLRSKNYTFIVPNKPIRIRVDLNTYPIGYGFKYVIYDANKQYVTGQDVYGWAGLLIDVPSNGYFIKFVTNQNYGTTYKNDISVELYYTPAEGGEGYGEMHDYVAPIRIDTGNEPLLAFDTKDPDGTWHKNTKTKDLGTINYTASGSSGIFYASFASFPIVKNTDKMIANGYITSNVNTTWSIDSLGDKTIHMFYTNGYYYLIVANSAFAGYTAAQAKTALSGTILNYLTDAPTTEQGTPFIEYATINDYSYMAWFDTDGNLVSIPQGCKLFYPVDYKGYTDDLVMYTNGDATALAKKSDIDDTSLNARGYYKMQDLLTTFGANGMVGGTLRQTLANAKSLDFRKTACVKMIDMPWQYNENGYFISVLENKKAGALTMLCTIFGTGSGTGVASITDGQITSGTGNTNIFVIDTSCNGNLTAFIEKIKYQLIAYELAD